MAPYNTYRLDWLIQAKTATAESDRQQTLQVVLKWLDQWGQHYGMEQAYIFGSLLRPGHFTAASDVDVATETLDLEKHFQAIAHLSRVVERDADLIPLDHCPFAARIRATGWLWTAPTS